MADFKPPSPFSVPMMLLIPDYKAVNGVRTKSFDDKSGIIFFGSFQTFGGTETTANGIYAVEDTATVVTWYKPEIKANCRVKLLDDNTEYEIVGSPENINRRNQFLKFKLVRTGGGA